MNFYFGFSPFLVSLLLTARTVNVLAAHFHFSIRWVSLKNCFLFEYLENKEKEIENISFDELNWNHQSVLNSHCFTFIFINTHFILRKKNKLHFYRDFLRGFNQTKRIKVSARERKKTFSFNWITATVNSLLHVFSSEVSCDDEEIWIIIHFVARSCVFLSRD